jgi:3-(3-hydroxy-phenyl)propionate hydroxylase
MRFAPLPAATGAERDSHKSSKGAAAVSKRADRVIIVGGGPVGLTTALLLVQRGVPVTLFERNREVQHDYRASTFHAPTLDLLEESGITAALLRMGIQCPVFQYRGWQEGKIAEFDHAVIKDETRHPFRLQCEQFKLSGYLHERLSTTEGIELLYGHEVTGIRQDENGVEVVAAGPEGIKTVRADYLIGADGGRSMVRKALEIEFTGFTYPERILVIGTTLDFKTVFPDLANVNYVSDPENHAHILRIPDLWRISLPVAAEVSDEEAKSDAAIEGRLRQVMPDVAFPDIRVRAVYHVHQRVATTYRKGRAFLVGDAAHLNSPKGGMGLNGGLHDTVSLTDHLARVWHGKADETELDGYEAQRRPEAINAILKQTESNTKNLKEADGDARQRLFAEWRKMASDPALAKAHLLQTSMIASLRRCGMLR